MEANNNNNMADNRHTILELYKLHVEMADRVSHRRGIANNLFLVIHTSIISVSGLTIFLLLYIQHIYNNIIWWRSDGLTIKYFEQFKIPLLIVMALGIALALIWKELILSYKKLNNAKFKVINKIEEDHFPIQPYVDEYDYYTKDKRKDFSIIEKRIPIVLVAVYIIAIVVILFTFYQR